MLPDSIKSAKLTAQWEAALKDVEHGQQAAADFLTRIERMVADLVEAIGLSRRIRPCSTCGKALGNAPAAEKMWWKAS